MPPKTPLTEHTLESTAPSPADVRRIRQSLRQIGREHRVIKHDVFALSSSVVLHAIVALLLMLMISDPLPKRVAPSSFSFALEPVIWLERKKEPIVEVPTQPEPTHEKTVEAPPAEAPPVVAKAPQQPQAVKAPKRRAVVRKKRKKRVARRTQPMKTVAPAIADADAEPAVEPAMSPAAIVDPTADTEVAQGPSDGTDDGQIDTGDADAPDVDVAALMAQYRQRVARVVSRSRQYPRAASRAHIEGRVVIALVVDGTGSIVNASIHQSSGHRILDQAALKAIQKLGSLPAPPAELFWTTRALHVPFVYRLS